MPARISDRPVRVEMATSSLMQPNGLGAQLRGTGRRGPKVDTRKLSDSDWSALCHVSCSALLDSANS
jgi:hypothetical protein